MKYAREEYRRCGYCLYYWVPDSIPMYRTLRNPFPAAVSGIKNGKDDFGAEKPFFRSVMTEPCPACRGPGAAAARQRADESQRRIEAEHAKELAEQDITRDLEGLT